MFQGAMPAASSFGHVGHVSLRGARIEFGPAQQSSLHPQKAYSTPATNHGTEPACVALGRIPSPIWWLARLDVRSTWRQGSTRLVGHKSPSYTFAPAWTRFAGAKLRPEVET